MSCGIALASFLLKGCCVQSGDSGRPTLIVNAVYKDDMEGRCDRCGMSNVEVKTITAENNQRMTLCNQCRPADGAYAY